MDTAEILQSAEALLQPWAKAVARPAANRLDVTLEPAALMAAVSALQQAHLGYLAAITGLDHPAPEAAQGAGQPAPGTGTIEVLYHFCEGAAVVTLRVHVPYGTSGDPDGLCTAGQGASTPVIPTVCGVIPAATLYERELAELFGVEVQGTPDPNRLVLADDWPEGVYPLRKSFKGFSAKTGAG